MLQDHYPRLRPYVECVPDPGNPRYGFVIDALRQCPEPLRLPLEEFRWLQWFDGERSFREIQAAAAQQFGEDKPPLAKLLDLNRQLDEALLLESPRWQERLDSPIREPVCIGCYQEDADALTRQVGELFTAPAGPGLPRPPQPDGRLRGALIPHIDYARGGVSYAWGFKEVFERTDARLFVIIGTSHYSQERFTLTRKNFKTPLGVVPTDQDFIDRLVGHYGDGLFDDELQAHFPEHSIELEVVFLQWFYQRRPIRIVPLVVGSFHDATLLNKPPSALSDIGRMVEALRAAEAQTAEPICYIISGDMAHIGPKFEQGRGPVGQRELAQSRKQDQALLSRLEHVDTAGFFKILADERDKRAICGFPPTITALDTTQPSRGKVLHYDRYIHPRGFESVSFASVAFYR